MIDFNDIHLWKTGDELKKYNFKENVKIECYDVANKTKAMNIIRNNDFLQYHYFSQDYAPVKAASYIYLFYLTYNGIKMYIGFASIACPTISKKIRRKYFGKRFLGSVYLESKKETGEVQHKIYVLSRMVLLPSYRGLGLARSILEYIVVDMRSKSFYIEMLSNMFHNYYFAGYEFNTIFIDLKKKLSKDEYDNYFDPDHDEKTSHHRRGYKGKSKFLANMVFDFGKNDFMKDLLLKKHGVSVDWDNKRDLSAEQILWCQESGIPLVLAEYSDFEYLKANKDLINQTEDDYILNVVDRHKHLIPEEGEKW